MLTNAAFIWLKKISIAIQIVIAIQIAVYYYNTY